MITTTNKQTTNTPITIPAIAPAERPEFVEPITTL